MATDEQAMRARYDGLAEWYDARRRSNRLVQGDAERLPIRSSVFPMAVSSWTSTHVEHLDRMLAEVARVLVLGGPVSVNSPVRFIGSARDAAASRR
jgi:ubiquinone/menaquinone biosynthesis C-methylase UbiE